MKTVVKLLEPTKCNALMEEYLFPDPHAPWRRRTRMNCREYFQGVINIG